MVIRFHFGPVSGGEPLPIVTLTLIDEITQATTPPLTALIDTGADGTLIPYQILQNAGFRPNRQRRKLFSVQTGQPPETVLGYLVTVRIGDIQLDEVDVYGSRTVNDVILGRNVLNRMVFTYDGPALLFELLTVDE
ncbi:MAG: retropepsin-like aspartic protease [Caldilineaceae bacterium]